jgi:hypothetical protein
MDNESKQVKIKRTELLDYLNDRRALIASSSRAE